MWCSSHGVPRWDIASVPFLAWICQVWCSWRGVTRCGVSGVVFLAWSSQAWHSQAWHPWHGAPSWHVSFRIQAAHRREAQLFLDARQMPPIFPVLGTWHPTAPFPLMFIRQCRFGFPAVCSLVGVASFVSRCGAAQNVQTIQKFQKASALHVLFSPGK